jgi:hypothetical protein
MLGFISLVVCFLINPSPPNILIELGVSPKGDDLDGTSRL